MLLEIFLLFAAGFFGGVLNSIAGGGTFITFPALLMAGVPPISANASNTFASCAGYISGTYGFRQELKEHKKELPWFIFFSLIGGAIGAWLLLRTPETLFREVIPWLLLFATVLFTFGGQMNEALKRYTANHKHASSAGKIALTLLFLGVSIYGGFFNAGLGIISLSYLALAGYTNISTMNGIKLLVSTCVSLIAIVLFVFEGAIAWYEGSVVLAGSLVGGYLAARISRNVPQAHVRNIVIFASSSITLYFFYDFYLA